ncbi:MAG: putative ABC transport system permease protein [Candidatus Nitrotoga sp. CP45]|nr:MAG: putative ABC transport system permease protein [Candidatus Nitrotoga sp. CP45]
MNHLLHIALRSAWNRRLTLGLTLVAIALSVAMLLGVERLRYEAHRGFSLSISGTDLVVGARTSPVQLILYAVFRIGEATSNIAWKSFQDIAENPLVAWAVPISLGDSHHGFPVMGTTPAYFEHFHYSDSRQLSFVKGQPFRDVFDVVLGMEVASQLGYVIGDRIILSHGMGEVGLLAHDDKPFIVSGILAPTGTPVDRTLHISLEGITAIHLNWVGGVPMHGFTIPGEHVRKFDLTPKDVTAALVGMKSRAAVFKVQRQINEYKAEPLLAVMPGVALEQLWQVVGVAEKTLLAVTSMVVFVGLSGLAAVLLASLNERRREMAVLRAIGARRRDIFLLMVSESLLVTLGGIVLGIILLSAASLTLAPWVQANYGISLQPALVSVTELKLLVGVLVVGLLAGLLPGYRAYKMSLMDGLMSRI